MPPGLDPAQLRDLVVRPVLTLLDLPSPAASERLLMGTAAQESRLRYLKQLGTGPALGLWQMEPLTFRDLWSRFGPGSRKGIGIILDQFVARPRTTIPISSAELTGQLVWNLRLACAMCRVHYYARPFSMPQEPNPPVETLAAIWKEHYNTWQGRGREEEFVEAYEELVAPIYRSRH